MLWSGLEILILVLVIAWLAARLPRRKPATFTDSRPTAMDSWTPRQSVPQNVEQDASSTEETPRYAQHESTEHALAVLASCARPRGIGDLTTVIQVRVADEGLAAWQFNFTNGACALLRGTTDEASLTISADSEVWRDLAAKRIGFSGARMKGSLQTEGDLGILMKLDAAFAGAPDESLFAGASQPPLSLDEGLSGTILNPGGVDASRPVVMDTRALIDAVRAAKQNPNLSPAERQAAMLEAVRHNLGPGAVAGINQADGTVGNSFTSFTISTDSTAAGSDFRRSIQEAMSNLPPGATREQKLAAVKAALATNPNGAPFAAMLDANGSESHRGMGGKIAELMIEGLLEGLLGGD